MSGVFARRLLSEGLQIRSHHLGHEIFEGCGVVPPETCGRLAGVPNQFLNLSRSKITAIHPDEIFASGSVDASFVDTPALPFNASPNFSEGKLDELSDRGCGGRRPATLNCTLAYQAARLAQRWAADGAKFVNFFLPTAIFRALKCPFSLFWTKDLCQSPAFAGKTAINPITIAYALAPFGRERGP